MTELREIAEHHEASDVALRLERRLETLRRGEAYANYLRVRDEVFAMKDTRAPTTGEPSDYWLEELESIEYLLDASPLVVERLRHHTYTVTGIRAYDYRTGKDAQRLAEKLDALVEIGGRDLLVPEPRLLGGFGFEIEGELYNVDTLKYYEALIAMDRGGILGGFTDSGERRLVCEIGPGFGGFAYQFKTLFPNTTYVMVDLPELFLFSATYLLTAFPDANVVFGSRAELLSEESWLAADFVFLPNTALHLLRPPRLDVTVNMVSFQEMTATQVEEYVRTVHALGSPFIYSLNREHSHYNEQIESVTAIVDQYFWTRVVPVLPVSYTKMLDAAKARKRDKKGKAVRPGKELDYKHVVGTRRIVR